MRIGVVGLGFMGSMHLKALRDIPDAQVTAVYSRDESKLTGDLSSIQGNLGGPGEKFDFSKVAKYRDIDQLIGDPTVDALDICLPTNLHAPVTLAALAAGKDVLVEKPMALDFTTAQKMVDTAKQHGRILMVAQVLRFFPAYRALRAALTSGSLGETRFATFRRRCAAPAWSKWQTDPDQAGGGVFDLLIHDIDMCLHLFGTPQSVSAKGYEKLDAGIDVIAGELQYNGFTSLVEGGWHHPKSFPFSMEFTVVTDGGTIDYKSPEALPKLYDAQGESREVTADSQDGYLGEIAYFVECCKARKAPALCPPEESAEAIKLTHLLLESRTQGGKEIRWES